MLQTPSYNENTVSTPSSSSQKNLNSFSKEIPDWINNNLLNTNKSLDSINKISRKLNRRWSVSTPSFDLSGNQKKKL